VLKCIANKNPEPAIEVVKEIIKISVSLSDLDLFSKSIELLADLYLINRDFQNGIYCYN